jgi:AbrB family looped-hinge helix DNA binding protein
MQDYIHKVNGIIGKASLSVVLPKNIIKDLHIQKGDYVEITRSNEEIIIKKLRV